MLDSFEHFCFTTQPMIRLLFCFSILSLGFFGCQKEDGIAWEKIQPGEAGLSVYLDGKPFYPEVSRFKGDITAFPAQFRVSLFDQFQSNVVISFSGDEWYRQKPIDRSVFHENQVSASVMIGKLIDAQAQKGEGYLMTDGQIKIKTWTAERLEMQIEGLVGLYQHQQEPDRWIPAKLILRYKNPPCQWQGIDPSSVYYE